MVRGADTVGRDAGVHRADALGNLAQIERGDGGVLREAAVEDKADIPLEFRAEGFPAASAEVARVTDKIKMAGD